jgi:hypothetical protein
MHPRNEGEDALEHMSRKYEKPFGRNQYDCAEICPWKAKIDSNHVLANFL